MNARCIAVVPVDLNDPGLGRRPRLADSLAGRSVLARTIDRLLGASRLAAVHVVCPPEQQAAVADLLAGGRVRIEPMALPPAPFRDLVRAGRIWAPDSWRGGIGGLCAFDEQIHLTAAARVAQRAAVEAVVHVPPGSALVHPALIDGLLEHFERLKQQPPPLAFCQAPPGLAPTLFTASLLNELAPSGQPPGMLLTYRPDQPQPDPTGKPACYRPAATVVEASGRLIADTQRSFERLERLVAAGAESWPAERVAEWLGAAAFEAASPGPEEVEIELTTAHDGGADILRPRTVASRSPMDLDVLRRLIDGWAAVDDVRVVLGGFGEPALHPRFGEVCRLLRPSAAAIAVVTSGRSGGTEFDDLCFSTPIDAIIVELDAATPETYRRIHGIDAFEAVTARVEGWLQRRRDLRQVRPLIVPTFRKANENFADMEEFFDGWLRRTGTAVIRGPTNYGGQRPDRFVTQVAPPRRGPCRQIFRRTMVLADGTFVSCDQDYGGKQPVDQAGRPSLGQIWNNEKYGRLRNDHVNGELSAWPLCPGCDAWHRP